MLATHRFHGRPRHRHRRNRLSVYCCIDCGLGLAKSLSRISRRFGSFAGSGVGSESARVRRSISCISRTIGSCSSRSFGRSRHEERQKSRPPPLRGETIVFFERRASSGNLIGQFSVGESLAHSLVWLNSGPSLRWFLDQSSLKSAFFTDDDLYLAANPFRSSK